MRTLKISLSVILMVFCLEAGAQSFVENALLFSRTKPGGSARIQGMGGAQVALGGDYSSALSNPAGLGMYNRSEFTLSPALNFYKTTSNDLGNELDDSKTVFNVPGASLVWHLPVEKGNFFGGSFGISVTRTNDFQNAFQYGSNTTGSSIIDYFLEDAQGYVPESFDDGTFGGDIRTQLGYGNYLIEDSSSFGGPETEYYSVLGMYPDNPNDIRHFKRHGNVNIKGAQYQVSLAYGGNLSDKFYFGANLGISTIRYRFKSTYRESNFAFDLEPTYEPLDYLELEETIDIEGTGFNLTLGMIYRPADFIQIGASLVTPTFYALTDTYTARLSTQWNNFDYFGTGEPEDFLNFVSSDLQTPLVSEYNITTPMKFSVGTAIFLDKYGFITGDIEFVNYNKAKYSATSPGVSFDPENDEIKSSLNNVINMRLGAEFRLDVYRLRGGFGLQPNPYNNGVSTTDFKQTTISFGGGIKLQKFFIDAAWQQTKGNSAFSIYGFSDNTGPVASIKNTLNSVMLTVGFNF